MASKTNKEKEEILDAATTFVHPKSRKCIAIVKKVRKESKKEQHKKENKLKQSLIAEKLLWFQNNMEPDVCPYPVDLTAELIEKYIARNDEELEQIQIKRSIGGNRNKQHIGREDAIRMTKERERNDYKTCGLEIPDILVKAHCEMLRKWNGDIKLLPNFKFTRFSIKRFEAHQKQKAKIPPSKENDASTSTNKNASEEATGESTNPSNHLDKDNDESSKSNQESMDVE